MLILSVIKTDAFRDKFSAHHFYNSLIIQWVSDQQTRYNWSANIRIYLFIHLLWKLQKDINKPVSVMDCMCNKYGESEDLRKTWDEAREMFISFYDAVVQKSQREAQGFNTDVMNEAIADFQSAHVEFQKLQLKQKANNDLYAPSFSPILPLHKPDGEAQIPGDTLVLDASIIVEKEDHRGHVVLDQPNSIVKKDNSIPSYSLGLGLSQLDSQSLVPLTTSIPDPSTTRVNEDDGSEDDDEGAPLRFLLRNTS